MSKKPFLTFALATSLILGIAQRSPGEAPRVYLCVPATGASECNCDEKVHAWETQLPAEESFNLCLRVGSHESTDPPTADCAPSPSTSPGNGDEVCGWEVRVRAQAGLEIKSFTKTREMSLYDN